MSSTDKLQDDTAMARSHMTDYQMSHDRSHMVDDRSHVTDNYRSHGRCVGHMTDDRSHVMDKMW